MIQIPYYMQQRLTKRLIDVVMILFLIITLFPIFWMVFSSFKSNTEILLGKIPFGRAGNDVVYSEQRGVNLFVLTADGGIDKFDLGTNKVSKYTSIKSMATNYLMDETNIWASTADKGLIQISTDDFSKKRQFDPKLKELDINKIVSTFMIQDNNYLWMGWQQKGIEKILVFNKYKRDFTSQISLKSPLSPLQAICMTKTGNVLWVGTNKGLLKIDTVTGSIQRSFTFENMNIPFGDIKKIAMLKNNILLGTVNGIYEITQNGVLLRSINSEKGLLSDRINSISVAGSKILVGSNGGLSVIDIRTAKISNYDRIFTPIEGSRDKGLTNGDVFSISQAADSFFVGSSSGRISQLAMSNLSVKNSYIAKEGHTLVRWRNYVDLWKNIDFALYLKNSLIICGITMVLAMIFATLAAYALARFNFPGNQFFSIGVLATQMIPAIMYLIPIYIMFTQFNNLTGVPLKGTYFGLIMIYSAFFIPFSIWILRGFFASIPVELEEAARIDGCSPFQVFWFVVLPLAVPGIIATGVYVFLTAWDELMFAWVLCNGDTMTIPVGIRLFVGNYQNRFDLMMAAATVATIPVMILFFMLQKHIVKGLTAGAVKG